MILVTGPSRGGKSRWAEHLMSELTDVVYIASCMAITGDPQWNQRIEVHKLRRPSHWRLVEAPQDLSFTIQQFRTSNILIDSLGGFVAQNLKLTETEWAKCIRILIEIIQLHKTKIIIVIEETGWGVIPSSSDGILFRDRLGSLAQLLEVSSTHSWLVIQGRAINLKQIGIPVPL